MPLSAHRYFQIKGQLKLWNIIEPTATTDAALQEMFAEMRAVLNELITVNESDNPPTLWDRIKGVFGG